MYCTYLWNSVINKILNKEYSNNHSFVIGLGGISVFMNILNLIFTIFLKYNKNRIIIPNSNYRDYPGIPLPMQGVAQTVYIQQQSPINNVGYAIPYIPYSNNQLNNVNPNLTPFAVSTPTPYISNQVLNKEIQSSSN